MNAKPPELTVPSPAKVNLFLHVTGQRDDGYHLLQTVFQCLDFADEMGFNTSRDGVLRRHDGHLYELPQRDLCIRAADALRQHAGQSDLGIEITLDKKIPPGAGLGGGSSNAATTLLVLNRLWHVNAPFSKLMDMGRDLGADVPVFLHGHSAWAEGVGDEFSPCMPSTGWVVVALPDVSVSTAESFASPSLRRDHPRITMREFEAGHGGNDLEAITFSRYPEVAAAHEFLSDYGPARMSGTGSAVFVPVADRESGEGILRRMPADMRGIVTRRCNRSPLLDRLP